MADTRSLTDLIKSRHPSYDAGLSNFYWNAYLGGREFHQYLETHKKEDPSVFQDRKLRSYYFNYLKNIANIITDFVFKGDQIERKGLDEAFSDSVDRKGTDIDSFMAQAALRAIIRGRHFVAVDNEILEADSLADEQAEGKTPYWYHIDDPDMLNYELDEYGRPYWVLFKDYAPPNADPFARRDNRCFFKLWTREVWQTISAEVDRGGNYRRVQLEAEGINELGVVPVECIYGDFLADWVGGSWICDIAHISKALLNTCSLRDNYMYETAIEQLVMPGAQAEEIEDFLKGPRYVITTNGPEFKPFVVGPSGVAAAILQAQENDLIGHIYRLLSQRITNASAAADGASGVSKQVDFEVSTNTTLSGLADECERAERQLHAFRSLYNPSIKEVDPCYPDDFNVSALDMAIKRAMDMSTLEQPPELTKFTLKRIWAKLRPMSEDPKEIKEVEAAIEEYFNEPFDAPEGDPAVVEMVPGSEDESTPTGAVNPGQTKNRSMNNA